MSYLSTSDLARAVGAHPNTVRRYVERGLLPPVRRGANGYRLFTQRHLDCMRVARTIHAAPFAGQALRASGTQIIHSVVADDWGGALEHAYAHLALVRAERAHAETAATLLERWAGGMAADATAQPLRIGQVARLLGMSVDVLRNWERSGLISVPRLASNRYRSYGSAEISRLRVIRMLARSGFSHMAILRMLLRLDQGITTQLRQALDTPAPDEDARIAADRWLSALAGHEADALRLIVLIEEVIAARTTHHRAD
ncbi:MAG TPA: MerR family transcriptional regulator [Ktedonobacterales bacterium]